MRPDSGNEQPPARLEVRQLDGVSDPGRAFAALFGYSRDAFWLDSSRVGDGAHFSFMGDASGPLAATVAYDVVARQVTVRRGDETEVLEESILDYLARQLEPPQPPAVELPFDFDCGFVGYLGYELKADCGAVASHASAQPDAAFVRADRVVAFDHRDDRVYLLALAAPDGGAEADAWIEATAATLATLSSEPIPPAASPPPRKPVEFSPARSPAQHLDDIAACEERLLEGESYEICLTNSVTASVGGDPLDLYMELRRVNPAPFASYLRFGGLSILSSSPERFLKVDRQGGVEAKPIKGTSRRGDSPAEDARLAEELRTSEKNRAENLMIVDLMRNDLGSVCAVGSVEVSALMEVETYETVHQLVSTVRGRLRPEAGALDCVRACFPPGSMTGAPKLRTMEILEELEGRARGVYSGAIGYFGHGGGCDLSVTIRTIVLDDGVATIGAGGAIVLQSDAESELREALLKAQAPMRAIDPGAALRFSAHVSQATGELAGGRSATPSAEAWDALAERAEAPPFLRPGWFEAWMRAFGEGAALETIEVRRDADLVAAIPLLRHRRTLRSPTNWHTPMFGPLAIDDAARDELLANLFAERAVVDLDNFGGAGTEAEAVAEAARQAGRRVTTRHLARSPVIHLEGDFEAYEGTLSRNRRKALRRHRRKLEEQGKLEFEVHDGRTDLERLLGELFAVEASGWKGQRGTAISSRPETERFYADIARWAADRGWLRLAFHRLDGRPIACDFALEQGGAWYTLKAGYEDDLRSFGPGALLLRDEIAHCCERGVSRVELLGEEDEFKASWTDAHTERVRVRAFAPGPLGAAHGAAAGGWERLRPALRDLKQKLSR